MAQGFWWQGISYHWCKLLTFATVIQMKSTSFQLRADQGIQDFQTAKSSGQRYSKDLLCKSTNQELWMIKHNFCCCERLNLVVNASKGNIHLYKCLPLDVHAVMSPLCCEIGQRKVSRPATSYACYVHSSCQHVLSLRPICPWMSEIPQCIKYCHNWIASVY